MKGKKLLCIVLSLAAVCSLLLIRDSAAWQKTYTGTSPSSLIVVDKMAFDFDGSLGTYLEYPVGDNAGDPYLVTEQNLIVTNGGKITVTNYSTIDTEARFKIYYDTPGHYYDDDPNSNTANVYTGSSTDSLSVDIGSNWVLDTTDNCFHYQQAEVQDSSSESGESESPEESGGSGSTEVIIDYFPAVGAEDDPEPVDAITNIMYLDELYVDRNGTPTDILEHTDYFPQNGNPFHGSVHIIFEAKQKDHVDWSTITSWATS